MGLILSSALHFSPNETEKRRTSRSKTATPSFNKRASSSDLKKPNNRASNARSQSPLNDTKGLEFRRNYLKRLGVNLHKIKEELIRETQLKLAHIHPYKNSHSTYEGNYSRSLVDRDCSFSFEREFSCDSTQDGDALNTSGSLVRQGFLQNRFERQGSFFSTLSSSSKEIHTSTPLLRPPELDEHNKLGVHIRRKYYSRLIDMKIWKLPEQKEDPCQTVLIFDWDDTLLCTSRIIPNGVFQNKPVSHRMAKQLRIMDKAGTILLRKALQLGKVFIITNAMQGWVEFSAKLYLPNVASLFKKVKVISARGQFEDKYPSKEWKKMAFLELQRYVVQGAKVYNFVSLGDSNNEIKATHNLAQQYDHSLIKTVKFKDDPDIQDIIKQLKLVTKKLELICGTVGNLAVKLERKEVEEEPQQEVMSWKGEDELAGVPPSFTSFKSQ